MKRPTRQPDPGPGAAAVVDMRPLADLIAYARNARRHSPAQIRDLAASIDAFGLAGTLVIRAGTIAKGHGTLAACQRLIAAGKRIYPVPGRAAGAAPYPAGQLPVQDATGWSDAEFRAFVIADNKHAEGSDWDLEILAAELSDLRLTDLDLSVIGYDSAALDTLLGIAQAPPPAPRTDPDLIPEPPPDPTTKPGDIWQLGPHRLLCGDSTNVAAMATLLNGTVPDLICTDPPYCSGGFQEAGKSAGSVGRRTAYKKVANDALSTRGYQTLLKAAFGVTGAPYLYAFTDWRMWIHLFDIVESIGMGVRAMLVWDKGTPGMGRGWRAQHELILWAGNAPMPFDKGAPAHGNVLQAQRTGNLLHTTQKPVDLIEQLIANTPFARTIVDPFNGSGTTLLACERQGRTYFGAELDPAYCDVTVQRWQDHTGNTATHAVTGAPFTVAGAPA